MTSSDILSELHDQEVEGGEIDSTFEVFRNFEAYVKESRETH